MSEKRKAKRRVRPKPVRRPHTRRVKVENPFGEGVDKVDRVIDPLILMRLTPRQLQAANIYRDAYQLTGSAGLKSVLDDSKIGGVSPGSRTVSSGHLWAAERLAQATAVLGEYDSIVMRLVCGEGYTIKQATAAMRGTTPVRGKDGKVRMEVAERDRDAIGDRYRTANDLLAKRWIKPDKRRTIEAERGEASTVITKPGKSELKIKSNVVHASAHKIVGVDKDDPALRRYPLKRKA